MSSRDIVLYTNETNLTVLGTISLAAQSLHILLTPKSNHHRILNLTTLCRLVDTCV